MRGANMNEFNELIGGATGNLLEELEEAEKIGNNSEEVLSITVDYGSFLTILCC